MQKVAVFGNAGGGKSTLSHRLAKATGLPLYVLDLMQFPNGYQNTHREGGKIANQEYLKLHHEILGKDSWIMDGYGSLASAWERFAAADTLVYIDLAITTHYWGVTKRLVKGFFRNPSGWPENSPLQRSSLDSYRVVWLCHTRLTPKYRKLVANASSKRVHHLRSYSEQKCFLQAVEREYSNRPTLGAPEALTKER